MALSLNDNEKYQQLCKRLEQLEADVRVIKQLAYELFDVTPAPVSSKKKRLTIKERELKYL